MGTAYFCAPSTGLPACFRLESIVLLPVAPLDCVLLPDTVGLLEEVFPLPEAPLVVGTAVAGDAIVSISVEDLHNWASRE